METRRSLESRFETIETAGVRLEAPIRDINVPWAEETRGLPSRTLRGRSLDVWRWYAEATSQVIVRHGRRLSAWLLRTQELLGYPSLQITADFVLIMGLPGLFWMSICGLYESSISTLGIEKMIPYKPDLFPVAPSSAMVFLRPQLYTSSFCSTAFISSFITFRFPKSSSSSLNEAHHACLHLGRCLLGSSSMLGLRRSLSCSSRRRRS